VTGSAHTPFPTKTDPNTGEEYRVETPTVVSGVLDLSEAASRVVTATTEVFNYFPRLEIYGSAGVLVCNDPNMYGGTVTLTRKGGILIGLETPGFGEEGRALGVAEMAQAIAEGREPRAGGALMYHVLDVMHAIHDASSTGKHVAVTSTAARPEPFDYSSLAA
jgi:predicted dehydrogenase